MVDNVARVRIGGGKRLYKDARQDDPEEEQPKSKPKSVEDHPAPPSPPPWVVKPMTPEPEKPEPGTNWRSVFSTLLELVGIALMSGGLFLLAPWLGVTVLGVGVLLVGVALGLPAVTK